MKHVFLLLVFIGAGDDRYLSSGDMYFHSIERCNWFASQVSRRFASPNHLEYTSKDRVVAYCVPKLVNTSKLALEIY